MPNRNQWQKLNSVTSLHEHPSTRQSNRACETGASTTGSSIRSEAAGTASCKRGCMNYSV